MQDIDTDKLIQLVLEKDDFIDHLKSQICNLENALHHEMQVNENLTDMNIQLKDLIDHKKSGIKSNIIPHPSTINKLSEAVRRYANRIEELQDALIFCIDMVPQDRNVQFHIERLKTIAHKLA